MEFTGGLNNSTVNVAEIIDWYMLKIMKPVRHTVTKAIFTDPALGSL